MDCENVYTAVLTESGVEQISQDQLYFMIAVRWDFFLRRPTYLAFRRKKLSNTSFDICMHPSI